MSFITVLNWIIRIMLFVFQILTLLVINALCRILKLEHDADNSREV